MQQQQLIPKESKNIQYRLPLHFHARTAKALMDARIKIPEFQIEANIT